MLHWKTPFIALLLFLSFTEINGQFEPKAMINTTHQVLYSVAVSPYDANIMVGGSGTLSLYTSNGEFLNEYQGHNNRVLAIFWTNDWLVSVDEVGNILKMDPVTKDLVSSFTAASNIRGADMTKDRIALNYENQII